MKNIISIVMFFLIVFNLKFNHSDALANNLSPQKHNKNLHGLSYSNNNRNTVMLSLGAGASIFETSFVLSPNVIAEIHKNFNILTGFDFYTNSESIVKSFSVNLIPYLVINTSKKSHIQIGIGGAYFRKSFSPIFSSRFNFQLANKFFMGGEIKSLIAFGADAFPFPVLLLNFSFRV